MIEVHPEEFEKLLLGETIQHLIKGKLCLLVKHESGDVIRSEKIRVTGELRLERTYSYPIHLQNETVLQDVAIKNSAQLKGIFISGNAKTGSISIIEDAQIKKISINQTASIGSIWIKTSNEIDEIKISGKARVAGVNIYGESIIGDLRIAGHAETGGIRLAEESKAKEIQIDDYARTKEISISGMASLRDISVVSNAKTGKIRINDTATVGNCRVIDLGETGNLEISGSVGLGNVLIRSRQGVGNVLISDANKIGALNVIGNGSSGDITIKGKVVIEEVNILNRASVGNKYIGGNASIRNLNINSSEDTGKIQITENSKFESIEVKSNLKGIELSGFQVKQKIRITNARLNYVIIDGLKYPHEGELIIQDCSIRVLSFYAFNSEEKVRISGTKKLENSLETAYVRIHDSDFSKLLLIENQFRDFDFLVFQNSNIKNAFVANTYFPEHIQCFSQYGVLTYDDVRKINEDSQQKKLFYGQIKTIYKAQGNSTEALSIQAKELDQHYLSLNWRSSFWDKFILLYHRLTTFYGTRWQRGAMAFLIVSVVLYAILILKTDMVVWPGEEGFNLWPTVSHYFEFINPTTNILSKWSYIYVMEGVDPRSTNATLPAFTSFWLYLSKFIMVTLLYQFVQAFRKFGKV